MGLSCRSSFGVGVGMPAVIMRLGQMGDHVAHRLAHMLVVDGVQNLAPLAVSPKHVRASQQTQVMGHQRLRLAEILDEFADGSRCVETSEHQPEPVGLAQKAEHIRQLRDLS